LSQLYLLTRAGIAFRWLPFAIGCAVWARPLKLPANALELSKTNSALSLAERIGFLLILLLVGLVGLTAIVSAPNSGDAMQYHLPRVVQCTNHRTIEFFPTNERQQLDMPPFTEYAMLHLYLLYGSDRLAYVGFVVAASARMESSLRTRIMAAALQGTRPPSC
jgi:hypothetical protein